MVKGQRILISLLALGLGLLLALVAGLALAQGPEPAGELSVQVPMGTAFTYQGRLTDGGSPANGTYDFEFKLYDAASGGTQVGSTVTKDDVAVTNGLFTVQLDFGSSAFTGDGRWLEIGVRPGASTGAYTILSPRQALTAAPYALALPGLWTQQNTTSPNLIGGFSGNSVTSGVVGATIGGGGKSDDINYVTDEYGTVGGGAGNQAGDNEGTTYDATYCTVGGGFSNTASRWSATVGGGGGNVASGSAATVGGGRDNTASGKDATVPGGQSNTAQGDYSFAAGRYAGANHQGAFVWADSNNFDFASTANDQFAVRANGGVVFSTGGGPFQINGGDVWTSANDGSGSGLDADMLDGQDSSHYLDTLRGLSCSNGQVAKWNSTTSQWECGNDNTGGVGGDFWSLTGNAGTSGSNFLGTTDNQALELRVNNARALRLEPNADSPNLIGGHGGNSVTSGVVGATIGGGGGPTDVWGGPYPNRVTDNYGTVGGGRDNTAGEEATVGGGRDNTASGAWATIAGGQGNTVSSQSATVGGGAVNTAREAYATVGGGNYNIASGEYATVGGGNANTSSGMWSTVAGGSGNDANAREATIGGGAANSASGRAATIGGGVLNSASGVYVTIGGGEHISVTGEAATVAGGTHITATAGWSTVGGGALNAILPPAHDLYESWAATIGGGENNEASDAHTTVGGGGNNTASGYASVVAGGGGYEYYMTTLPEWPSAGNTASGGWSTVGGGGNNTAGGYATTVGGGFGNDASADYATIAGGGRSNYLDPATGNRVTDHYGTVSGGGNNQAGSDNSEPGDAMYTTISGGENNTATWSHATVGGGAGNTAGGLYATVSGGRANSAAHDQATVGGGDDNIAVNVGATIGGGFSNTASGWTATVGGGTGNEASGWAATVPGGDDNTAQGNYSFAAGRRAKAIHDGAFVWADSTDADLVSGIANQFLVRASGGAYFSTNSSGFGMQVANSGDGDGIRAIANGSKGNWWGAVYAVNNGTSPAVYADTSGTYSGYFMDSIYVESSCIACTLVYIGLNDGSESLETGDLVAVSGVSSPLAGTTTLVMRVRRAGAGSAVIGVVQSKADIVKSSKDGQQLESANRVEGAAAPGDYVFIVVQGIAHVKADATAGAIVAGQRLTAADQPGHARGLRSKMLDDMTVTEGAPVIGIALTPLDKDSGTIPVFVTLR